MTTTTSDDRSTRNTAATLKEMENTLGELIESIVVGPDRQILSRDEGLRKLDVECDDFSGLFTPFVAWSASWVYSVYDTEGIGEVFALPRNPRPFAANRWLALDDTDSGVDEQWAKL